jgi:hypothetical protein
MNFIIPLIYGFLAASASLLLESFFVLMLYPEKNLSGTFFSPISFNSLLAVVLAVSIEEFFKLIFIRKIYSDLKTQGEIILSALFLGIGFSSIELLMYLFQGNFWFNIFNWYLWGVVFIHTLTSIIIGFLLCKKNSGKYWFLAAIFATSFALHLTYNLLVLFLFK